MPAPALSRRRFLRISAGSILAAQAASRATSAAAGAWSSAFGAKPGTTTTTPTFCDICFWKCNAVASVRDGALWKIEGNPSDPLSRGRLCPRGTGGIGAHTDPDRLRTPLIRVSDRGEEKWQEVTWDEALTYIADKMKGIAERHGPEAMALFSHGLGGTFFKHTLKAYGTPNISAPSFAQCRGPRDVGFNLTFGEGVGSPERTDIAHTRCLTLIGSHLGENMHNTQVQEFAEAVGAGATVICVDPRYSVAASKAKYWLPIRPGTDLALLLAWMHVIVTEKLYDADYIANYGYGFEQFAAYVQAFTPEWAYPETGIEPSVIRETAREMARHRPASLVHPGRHVNWYGDDAQRSRAIALLNALLGNWGRKGGFWVPSFMDVPGYPYPAYPKPARGRLDNPDEKYPFADEAITTGIRNATLSDEPYPIKGWMVYATNLLHALPDERATIEALKKLELLVVVDVIPSEIAGWADVVLPESNYLERHDDLNVEYFKQPFVALRQPVVESPHDQKPGWWIARQLALKLDLGRYYPWEHIEDYLKYRVDAAGLDWATLKRDGLILGPRPPIYFEEGVPAEFYTPTGKIEFYSNQLAEHGFDPIPRYTPPDPGPPGAFRLLYGRAPMHSFSRTHTNRLLADMMRENEVWLNATAARRLGLRSGDRVRLRNQDDVLSDPVLVKATQRIRSDCVFMVHGFGHTAKGLRHAYRQGASDAGLITRYKTDPLMGGTGMNINFVTLEPAEA
ncbi:molybdopterin-containing oxidoreductase family protein [Actomonas aquatica]|uniref:Molybdopterin-dependent oxidoreductase n=1 Tax=Actomonas aquatica TaxID=2866162 RepID=A0ABZ1C3M8_9BACT|nr:molybdopterin-dependent oxidoreductase [Opitutus sp. WL0086]WRQ86321.1 molybdopterin-dependent oxidoreductase [Opitutus sp. WL0086]